MNPLKIRNDFPIFKSHRDKPLVYLDNAATTHKPQVVIDAITNFYTHAYATVHRTLYPMGEAATTSYEAVRDKVARFINAKDRCEIIFTKGTTESINFIAQAWALQAIKPGDQVLVGSIEHHANLVPWQEVARATGASIVYLPLNPITYQFDNPEAYLSPKTKLVAVAHSSNVLGNVWNEGTHQLENFIKTAHTLGARVLVDAAQSVAHQKIDVQTLDADFLAFSGHKMFAPTGVGVLYIKKELHDTVQPYQVGGSMIWEVTYQGASWAKAPQKFEAGTPPIAAVIGLGAAIDYIDGHITFDQLRIHEAALCKQLIDGLLAIDGVTIIGNLASLATAGHLVCFAIKDIHTHDLASLLAQDGIAVRAGHHCAQPFVSSLDTSSLIRVSVTAYNTPQDIELFLQACTHALNLLKSALIL